MLPIVLACAAAFICLPRPHARAQGQTRDRVARTHFHKAEQAFNLGKFSQALAGYEAAYQAKPLPGLLFNIAQCHRNLRDPERAIFFYKRYLALDPDTTNRKLVEELTAGQEKLLDRRGGSRGIAPSPGVSGPGGSRAGAPGSVPVSAQSGTAGPLHAASSPPDPLALLPLPPETRPLDMRPAPLGVEAAASRPPLYQRWWVWGAGAVVLGGVAAALLITREGDPPRGTFDSIDLRK